MEIKFGKEEIKDFFERVKKQTKQYLPDERQGDDYVDLVVNSTLQDRSKGAWCADKAAANQAVDEILEDADISETFVKAWLPR